MGIDYAIWKWKEEPPSITAGLCYLLLAEGIECSDVAPLEVERLSGQIETAFPEIWGDTGDFPLSCEVLPTAILLGAYGSTPASTLEWFVSLAETEGMVFFDPQDESSISKADQQELRRRRKALRAREAAIRQERELAELNARAAEGDPKALFQLGNRYSFGEGVKKDPAKAFALFRRSAEEGYSDGMFNLAACYRFGEGVQRDIDSAIAWYERASETDKLFGPFALGEIYANGETGEVDRSKAVYYLQLAWENGNQDAVGLLKALDALPLEQPQPRGERSPMGSVRHLYTTTDNDPEIEPEQYYRHYLYCDACGSFELSPGTVSEDLERERKRHRLAMAALVASPLVVVSLWSLLGFIMSPAALLALAAGMVIAPVLRGWVTKEIAAKRWRFVKWALLAIPMLLLADGLVNDVLSPWLMLVGGLLLIAGLLIARELVDSSPGSLGLRCRRCEATYAYGTPFFTDLDANPRHLTLAEVPRPLGASLFLRGASVE